MMALIKIKTHSVFLIIFLLSFLWIDSNSFARDMRQHQAWISFILDAPGQASWVRINTSAAGGSFAFDFGQSGTIPMLALPFSSPAIQYFIGTIGLPNPTQTIQIPGVARVDLNPQIPIIYSTIFENNTAWMIINGMPNSIISQCINGKNLRLKVTLNGMDYFYNFSLRGFTASLQRAVSLYKSLFGSTLPDSAYF